MAKGGLEEHQKARYINMSPFSLSSTRWHSTNTHLSGLGILGTERDYFPT